MAGHVMLCKKCREKMEEPFFGYYPFMEVNAICNTHNSVPLTQTPISCDEYLEIIDIAPRDISFLEAMIELKQKDPIEFQLKMSQFKSTQNQTKPVEESTGPHCPYCNSADLKKISGLSKVGSVALWGIFAMGKVGKQWHCNSCKSDF